MWKVISFLFLSIGLQLGSLSHAFSQEFVPGKYWVSFTDKTGTPYNVNQPEAFLSQRSIQRRQTQGIEINEDDLPVNPEYIQSLIEVPDVKVFYSSRWLNGVLIETLELASVDIIVQLPFVSAVTYVKPLLNTAKITSPQESIPETEQLQEVNSGMQAIAARNEFHYHQHNFMADYWEFLYSGLDYGLGRQQVMMVNGHVLHNEGFLGYNKGIAVLDSGFEQVDSLQGLDHLWQNNQILGYRDFVDAESNFFESHSHGTMVLSVMASNWPGALLGTARGADYWLLRTEDHRSEFIIEEYNWLAGAEMADSVGAHIINSSLGYSRYDDPSQDHTYDDMDGNTTVISRAANMAFERGILVVNSAGNYGQQNWRYIGAPADSFGALAIGAVDSTRTLVGFSSVGPSADGRVKPDVMAMGRNVVAETVTGALGLVNGTSFSSPIIAGMAACLWEKHPERSAAHIKRAIIESSNQFYFPDSLMGYGIPDFALADRLLESDFVHQQEPIAIFPNPFNANSVLSFFADANQRARIEVFDSTGRLISVDDNIIVHIGYNSVKPFSNLGNTAQGVYLIRVLLQDHATAHVVKAIKAW